MPGRTKAHKSIPTLENLLGYKFQDVSLVFQAITHPSLEGEPNYQRLEFLGDRVLGLVISSLLFQGFEKDHEGALSRRLASLVRKETLGEIAQDLNLGPLIRMTDTTERSGGRENPSILSDTLEALIGALYIDGGFEVARAFIERVWADPLAGKTPTKDPKSALQEWAQGRGLPLPDYNILERSGPDHSPSFTIEVQVENFGKSRAKGSSKREAETKAAKSLLTQLKALK